MGAWDLPPPGLLRGHDRFMVQCYLHALDISMGALLANTCPLLLHCADAHCDGREWSETWGPRRLSAQTVLGLVAGQSV